MLLNLGLSFLPFNVFLLIFIVLYYKENKIIFILDFLPNVTVTWLLSGYGGCDPSQCDCCIIISMLWRWSFAVQLSRDYEEAVMLPSSGIKSLAHFRKSIAQLCCDRGSFPNFLRIKLHSLSKVKKFHLFLVMRDCFRKKSWSLKK